jgi:hypothetical protein
MLTACWFLSASLKWGQEAIDAQSQWFHLVAWGLPAILTIVVQVATREPLALLTLVLLTYTESVLTGGLRIYPVRKLLTPPSVSPKNDNFLPLLRYASTGTYLHTHLPHHIL